MNKKVSVLIFSLSLFLLTGSSFSQDKKDDNLKDILLKNYRPKSIYKVPVTEIKKAKFPVVDAHSHAYANNPADVAQWVKNMDEMGIEKTIVLTMAAGKDFDSIQALYGKYPDRFILYCELDYEGYDKPGWSEKAIKELERCVKLGAKGIGELGDKGKGLFYGKEKAWGMHFDDPRMDPVLDKCADLNIPVSIHVADPIWMYEKMDSTNDGLMNAVTWRLDNQPGVKGHQEMVAVMEHAVKKHPKTIFISNHFMNLEYDLGQLGTLLDKYPNLYVDNSARYAESANTPRFTAAFYEKYQDRILYGTDMGFETGMYKITFRILETADEHFYANDLFGYHWALNGFALPDSVLKKIYKENVVKLLKKTIAKELFK